MTLLGLLEAELRFLPKILSDLETEDDWYPLYKYLHALKGTAGSIGATGLAAAAETLETAIKKRDSIVLEVAAFEVVANDTARTVGEYRVANYDQQS